MGEQYKLETEAETPIGLIKYVDASFDEGLKLITSEGGELIPARNLAFARDFLKNPNHLLSQYGSWIREGDIYIPKKEGILLLRHSLLLSQRLAKKAVSSYRNSKEAYIEKSLAEEYEAKASQSPDGEVFLLDNFEAIETKEFEEDLRALWLFQDQVEKYGRFLYNSGIKEMPLIFNCQDYIDKQPSPYANQLWLHRLADGGRSGLYGLDRLLLYGGRLRGVFPKTAEGGSQKLER